MKDTIEIDSRYVYLHNSVTSWPTGNTVLMADFLASLATAMRQKASLDNAIKNMQNILADALDKE